MAGTSEDAVWRNAPVPRRRTTLDRSNVTPELNAYIKGKAPKGEVRSRNLHLYSHQGESACVHEVSDAYSVCICFTQPTSYLELIRSLGELRTTGEKGHKQLLATVLPRLAQFEVLPAQMLVPQLLQLMSTGDDRQATRFVMLHAFCIGLKNTTLDSQHSIPKCDEQTQINSHYRQISFSICAGAWQGLYITCSRRFWEQVLQGHHHPYQVSPPPINNIPDDCDLWLVQVHLGGTGG